MQRFCCFTLFVFRVSLAQVLFRPVFVNESDIVPRVVGGTPAVLGELPYQVGFKRRTGHFRSNYMTFCGGSIIGVKKVLSAAHCFGKAGSPCTESKIVRGKKLRNTFAVAGYLYNQGSSRGDNQGGGQWRKLSKVVYPSRYKFPFHADIAVVMLRRPFVFNSHVNKITYARQYKDYKGPCLASGYGRISPTSAMTSEVLLKAHLTLLSSYWCNMKFRRNMKELICTTTTPTDVGQGDSGGPLVCTGTGDANETSHGILVGVVSGNRRHVASFFTRVSSFAKYIANNRSRRNMTYAFFDNGVFLICYSIHFMFLF